MTALVAAPSAHAAQTVLCKAEEVPCALANRWEGILFEMKAEPLKLLNNISNVECTASKASGTLGNSGAPQKATLSALSYVGCKTAQRSICTQCSNGCNIKFDYRVNQLQRVNARLNEAVNEEWTCDRGKFGHEYVSSRERLTKPLHKRDGKLVPIEWSEAYTILLEKLNAAQRLDSQNRAAGPMAMNANGYVAASANNDRLNIASRLVWFDPAEPHGLRVLAETLQSDPESSRREFAAYVLRLAGPGARAAIPALKAALNDRDRAVRPLSFSPALTNGISAWATSFGVW